MSIAEFKAALQDHAYKKWFKASSKSILNKPVKEFRDEEQVARKTSFIITDNTIREVAKYLSGSDIDEAKVLEIKNRMSSFLGKRRSLTIKPDNDLYFPRVSFKTIDTILNKGFSDLISASGTKKISDVFQKGHVYGIATNLLRQTSSNLEKSQTPENIKRILLDSLKKFEEELIRQDEATTNIRNPEYYLYAKYKKNPRKYLVELQLKTINEAAGRGVAGITNELRKYLNPENFVSLEKNLRNASDTSLMRKLLDSKGSPSFIELLTTEIVETLSGKTKSKKEYSSPLVKIAKQALVIDTKNIKKNIKTDISKVRNLKQKIKNIKVATQTQPSLTSIQSLINQALHDQIQKNMGTGMQRNVLNYRTGRFASTVKVERLSQSRQGMITAFYSYMKHPYQTFEPGFRQGSPESRNPKLLISKSIREIAAGLVGNRLRAVSI